MSSKKAFSVRPFEKLKKKITSTEKVPASRPPRQKKKEEYTDEELFSREMDDVQEIETFRRLHCDRHHPKNPSPAMPPAPDLEALTVLGEIAEGQRPINLPDTQEYVEWTNPGYHAGIIPKLHEGHFSIQAFLDLHGCTVLEAEEELDAFFQESFTKGLRCVKIIHGRGLRSVNGPVIKAGVLKRLSGRYRKHIIAYVSARQCDGGLGALYVLLEKK
jgi:DNA-nicking Smr family endonuclease